uniref:Uncharacterized protein n=1 Tax=candidate division CPR3 bacterium TaxID=2268181 RepID=A0A7C4R7P1_UNCC3
MTKAKGINTLYQVVVEIPYQALNEVKKTISYNRIKGFEIQDMDNIGENGKKALSFEIKIKMLNKEIMDEKEEWKKVREGAMHHIHKKMGAKIGSKFQLQMLHALIDEKVQFYFNFKRIDQEIPKDFKTLQYSD